MISGAAAAVVSNSRSDSDEPFDAVAWIQVNSRGADGPEAGDLDALQSSNPDAFALVKALLVKKSLGLIRRMRKTQTVEGSEEASSKAVGRSFFHWKPADDSDAVESVLGQVAGQASTLRDEQDKPAPLPKAAPRPPAPPKDVNAMAWEMMSKPEPVAASSQPSSSLGIGSRALLQAEAAQASAMRGSNSEMDIFAKGASQVEAGSSPSGDQDAGGTGDFWSSFNRQVRKPAGRGSPDAAAWIALAKKNQALLATGGDVDPKPPTPKYSTEHNAYAKILTDGNADAEEPATPEDYTKLLS